MSYVIREGFAGLGRAKFSTFIAVSVITISLIIIGIFLVIVVNAKSLIDRVRDRIELEVFIDNSADSTQIEQIGRHIKKIEGVDDIQYISKEEAASIFKRQFDETIFDILEENPLPASFRVQMMKNFQTAVKTNEIIHRLSQVEGIDDVIYRSDLMTLLEKYMNILVIVVSITGGILVLGSIFLVSNTIKLIIFSRQQIIETMKLVGATKGFIRRPFNIEGILQGMMGSVLAVIFLLFIFRLVDIEIPGLFIVQKEIYFILVGLGVILGFIGSMFAIQRFLRY